jgi:hypothetical protein
MATVASDPTVRSAQLARHWHAFCAAQKANFRESYRNIQSHSVSERGTSRVRQQQLERPLIRIATRQALLVRTRRKNILGAAVIAPPEF